MQVNVEKSGRCTAKVSLAVPSEEFRKEFQVNLQRAGRSVRMKGFRPGKIPAQVLEKHLGDQVRQDVMEHFLRQAYERARTEEELRPISHPHLSPDDLVLAADGSFALDFEVPLKPDFELPQYKGMEITSELEPVMAPQVEATLAQMRADRSVAEPAGEEGLTERGVALCDIAFLHEGEEVLEREGLRLGVFSSPPGVEQEAWQESLLGLKDGEERELPMVLPQDLEKEEARGTEGICRVRASEVSDMIPPPDEELFELVGVEDMETLENTIKDRLQEAAQTRERTRVEAVLLDRLIEEAALELPESLLEEQAASRLQALAREMKAREVPDEQIASQLEEQRSTAREEAEKGMQALLIVEALGEQEDLLVTAEELESELATIAARNQASIDEVRQYYAENNLNQQMAIEVLERKVRAFLYEHARITEPS